MNDHRRSFHNYNLVHVLCLFCADKEIRVVIRHFFGDAQNLAKLFVFGAGEIAVVVAADDDDASVVAAAMDCISIALNLNLLLLLW